MADRKCIICKESTKSRVYWPTNLEYNKYMNLFIYWTKANHRLKCSKRQVIMVPAEPIVFTFYI